ncbi:MAG: LysR substrate-binding domain-containing protein, partial [Nocardioides sp.]
LAQLRRGRVRLIAFPSAVATIVPEALRRLRLAQPGIDVSLAEAEPPEAVTALREDNADLALTFAYDEPRDVHGEIVWLPVITEPVDLVLPATHPAAVSRRLTLAVLADETWIGGCVRCRAHLVERCRAAGFEPRLSHATDDYVAVQALVGAGLGVSLLPRSALTAYRHHGVEVRTSTLFGTRRIGLAYRHGADQVPATGAAMRQLIECALADRRSPLIPAADDPD